MYANAKTLLFEIHRVYIKLEISIYFILLKKEIQTKIKSKFLVQIVKFIRGMQVCNYSLLDISCSERYAN